MNRKILTTLTLIFLFAFSSFAQNQSENLLKNVEVKFILQGDPTAQAVGFDNPKSYWKVKYELYLTDFAEPEKLGLSGLYDGYKYLAPVIDDKKFNKQIKKKSTKILTGSFTRKMLLNEANRESVVLINLPQSAVEIFNQAKNNGRNPTFVIFNTQKVSVKNSAKIKLKRKQFFIDFVPLKMIRNDLEIKYRDLKAMRLTTTITKREDGKLQYNGGLFHGLDW